MILTPSRRIIRPDEKPPFEWTQRFGLKRNHWAADGLVGLWLMNEGGGNKVYDLSGNGNTGTIATAVWGVGDSGPAIDCTQSSDIVLPSGVGNLSNFTFIAKFKLDTDDAFASNIIDNFNSNESSRVFMVWSGGEPLIQLYIDGANINFSPNIYLVKDTWYTFTWTYDGTTQKAYFDGIFKGEQVRAGSLDGGTATINLTGGWEALTGDIEYTYIYNRALSASEIAQLYREPFGMFERDEIVLWQSGAEPSVYDSIFMGCNF